MDNRLINLTHRFLRENYNYIYLKSMIRLAQKRGKNKTLIVGSSHALNAIDAYCFENAINCSMHSQDIFYDKLCIETILEGVDKDTEIKKCFLVFGYYIAFQDLSRGEKYGREMILKVYNPLFKNLHNCNEKIEYSLWDRYNEEDDNVRRYIEEKAIDIIEKRRNYYNDYRKRSPFFDFKSLKWSELSDIDRKEYGKQRAESHNKQYRFKESFKENMGLLRTCIEVLGEAGIRPIVVIPPFSHEYNLFVDEEMRNDVKNMIQQYQSIELLDFNQLDIGIDAEDFVDTDHLNERGAYKVSMYLVNKFGR